MVRFDFNVTKTDLPPDRVRSASYSATRSRNVFARAHCPYNGLITHLCASLFLAGRVTTAKSCPESWYASTNLRLLSCRMVYVSVPEGTNTQLCERSAWGVRVTTEKSALDTS